MGSIRIEKVSELILSFLGQEVLLLKDPRLQFLTITDVSVSADLKRAHIFWSIFSQSENGLAYPSEQEIESVDKALDKAKGRLRAKAGKALKLKYTPEFVFEYDATAKKANRIDELLAGIENEDK